MVKVGYTEFSFGYAYTENLIRSSTTAPLGAPVFPNLIQEATLGYDVRLDLPTTPLFLQYKLPDLMTRSTAIELSQYSCPGLTRPFFRIALMRRNLSDQHEKLVELEARYPGAVFYASPMLSSSSEFDSAYRTTSVHLSSLRFSPSEIGELPDDDQHDIAYRGNPDVAYFCSEPRRISAVSAGTERELLTRRFAEGRFADMETVAQELRKSVLEVARPSLRQAENVIEERVRTRLERYADLPLADEIGVAPATDTRAIVDVLVAREVARIAFGADLLIAQPRA